MKPGYVILVEKSNSRQGKDHSEKTINLASLSIDVNVKVTRCCRETGNSLNICRKSVEIPSTSSEPNVPNWDCETGWCAFEGWVVAETVLGFRNAEGEVAEALFDVGIDLIELMLVLA
jgi:hypothetical protein